LEHFLKEETSEQKAPDDARFLLYMKEEVKMPITEVQVSSEAPLVKNGDILIGSTVLNSPKKASESGLEANNPLDT